MQWEGEGKWRGYWRSVTRIKVCYLYMCKESMKKSSKYCFLKGETRKGIKGI
jgi:hypothetical protein